MQTSTTRLEKPLYLWLARMITLGIVLASIGISISSLSRMGVLSVCLLFGFHYCMKQRLNKENITKSAAVRVCIGKR